MNYLKRWTKRYYSIISNVVGFFVNTIGLALSIVGTMPGGRTEAEKLIVYLVAISEGFLILATIHSVVTVLQNHHTRDTIADKELALEDHKDAISTIVRKTYSSVTTYKDYVDNLNVIERKYLSRRDQYNSIPKDFDGEAEEKMEEYRRVSERTNFSYHEDDLIDLNNRFHITMINTLRDNIEKYLTTKECDCSVSVAIKQLDVPTKYSAIQDRQSNIYTAFRDAKTYQSKKRNETWEKTFSIKKNSDFEFSIEKGFYIFNFITREEFDNNLYLNENTNYYEHYNSGVTCTIHSCVEKEKILYGFLACDALFTKEDREKCGRAILDDNVANMMMNTAHLIALFQGRFDEIWNNYAIERSKKEGVDKDEYNLCKVMVKRVSKSRSPF